jgi:predicted RecA/RadA family phage recombinase
MKNYVQEGETLTLTAPVGGVVAGNGYKIGDIFVVANASAAAGAQFEGDTCGVFALPKVAAQTPAQGVKLYWDAAAGNVTTTSAGNTLIGVHASPVAAGASDPTIRVRLGIVA